VRTRRLAALVLAAGLAVATVACGDDSGDRQATPAGGGDVAGESAPRHPLLPAFDPEQELPPNDVGTLRRLYDPVFETMGLRLTRAALVDVSAGGYEPSDDGTHLALYVEPTGAYSEDDFAAGLWTVSALVTPDVFARWSGLESYDICQEPLPGVDDRPEPFPVTQINITRDDAATIDWDNGDLVELLVAAKANPEIRLIVNREVRASASYQAADGAARARAGSQPASN
jgi:hypothetical protein